MSGRVTLQTAKFDLSGSITLIVPITMDFSVTRRDGENKRLSMAWRVATG